MLECNKVPLFTLSCFLNIFGLVSSKGQLRLFLKSQLFSFEISEASQCGRYFIIIKKKCILHHKKQLIEMSYSGNLLNYNNKNVMLYYSLHTVYAM